MADSLDPVRPGETPPGVGAETFPIPAPTVLEPVMAASQAPVPARQQVSIYDAPSMPHADALAAGEHAELTRSKAGVVDAALAGVQSWAGMDVYRYLTTPEFERGDENVGQLIYDVKFPLSQAEVEYLRKNKSNSLDEHLYRLKQVEDNRARQQAMGDSAFGMVAAMLDPAWIIPGVVSGGLAGAANLGRLARFGVGAAVEGGAALGLNEVIAAARPMETDEAAMNVLTGVMVGGSAAVLFPGRPGVKPRKVDPDFPDQGLKDTVRDIPQQAPADNVVLRERPDGNGYEPTSTGTVKDTPAGARDIPPVSKETADIPTWDVHYAPVPLSKGLVRKTARQAVAEAALATDDPVLRQFFQFFQDKLGPALDKLPVYFKEGTLVKARPNVKGFYDVGGDRLQVQAGQPGWVLAHELTHAVTVNKLAYGRKNRNTVHGQITTELENLHRSAKQQLTDAGGITAYLGSDVEEFVAGLFTRDKKFVDILAAMPDPGNPRRSVLGKMVDAVRRLLGMPVQEMNGFLRGLQLVDELVDQPLKVIYHRPRRGGTSRIVGAEVLDQPSAVKAATAEADRLNADAQTLGQKWAYKGGWNYFKTLSKYSSDVAKRLLDDPLNPSRDSVDSWSRSIRAEFTVRQRVYEDTLRDILREQGITLRHAITQPGRYRAAQRAIEKSLQQELDFRNNYFVQYGERAPRRPEVPENIAKLADAHEDAMGFVLDEMKRSGVFGAGDIEAQAGYYPRRWSSRSLGDVEGRLLAKGVEQGTIDRAIVDGFKSALMRMNADWDAELAGKVAKSMVDRMRRKGDLLDADFRSHIGNAEIATISDMLDALDPVDKARVLDKLAAVRDEAGKATFLKSRLKIDIDYQVRLPDGSSIRLGDFLEANMSNLMERYMDEAAGRSAFARAGMYTPGDIDALKTQMIKDIRAKGGSTYEIQDATDLFDNAVKLLHGRPVGTNFAWGVRLSQGVTQMVGLGASGIWQITEYAKLMQTYGLLKALKYMRKSATFGEDLRKLSPEQAARLENILARNAYQDIRLRPLIEKLEDGFDIDPTSNVLHVANQAKQLVPYVNAMKFIHRHQANLVANLVMDTLEQGVRGNRKALDTLKRYGVDLESPLMGHVVNDIRAHGGDTSKWVDGSWDSLRNGLNRMMDDSVLRARRGDTPAFAQTSDLGKFLFTFRSFVLTAHNKTMMGTLSREGFAGYGLLLMYQYPLALMAVQMNNTKRRAEVTDAELIRQAIAQMGGLGLFVEAFAAVTGDKSQFGAPGLIAVDRGYNLANAIGSGSPGRVGASLLGAIPLMPLIPFTNALQETMKDQ